jgi:hypothetical protein
MLKSNRKFFLPTQNTIFRVKNLNDTNSSSTIEKQKAKLDFGWVSLFTLSITVFTAVMFGAGKAYRQNYLATFGFNDPVIPWSFQDVVYLGIVKQLPILLAAPMVAIGAVFGFAVLVGILLWLGNRLAVQRAKKSSSGRKVKTKSSTDSMLEVMQFMLNCFGAVLVIALLALFFVARAENLGGLDAKAAIESMAKGSKDKPKLPYVTIERRVGGQEIVETGYLVSCSERACGLYSPGKGAEPSRVVPLDGVTSFKYKDGSASLSKEE